MVACLGAYILSIAPIVPGSLLVPAGALVIGLVSGFEVFPWWFWMGQALLVATSLVIDNVAQAIGVQRIGGSRRAIVGGAVGVVVGPLALAPVLNLLALLIGPPIGAVAGTLVGEWSHRRRTEQQAAQAAHVARGLRLDMPTSTPAPVAAPASSMPRLGIGALLAWAVGTAARLALVTVQVAWLLLEL